MLRYILIMLICLFAFTACEMTSVNTETKIPEVMTESSLQSSKANSFTEEQKTLGEIAAAGLISYLQVDYSDANFDGTNGSECFAVGFRTSMIHSKAKERVSLVKEQKLIRKIKNYKIKSVEIEDKYGTVDLEFSTFTSSKSETKEEEISFKVYLINMGEDTWYISNVDPIIFP